MDILNFNYKTKDSDFTPVLYLYLLVQIIVQLFLVCYRYDDLVNCYSDLY